MAYYENNSDQRRMEESREMAMQAITDAQRAESVQGPAFDRATRLAELAVGLYDADVRRSKEHK